MSQGPVHYMVLCAPTAVVPGSVQERLSQERLSQERLPQERLVIKYVFHKVEHVQTFEFQEAYDVGVSIYTVVGSTVPCLLPLPQPFNNTLRYGPVLLFEVEGRRDFIQLWNDACMASLTWQHNRPKKTDDPLQKLGLPPKLNDFLKDQLLLNGLEVPVLSDDETMDAVEAVNEEKESVYETSSESESEATSIEYYTENEDAELEEEEEEDEQEPEPEEIDDGEENE